MPASGNFCVFNLSTVGSSYSVDQKGVGVEVLSWTNPTTNPPGCATPFPAATFTTSDRFVMRAETKPSGAVIQTVVTSDNFLDQGDPGGGYCLK
jgi:hypothetical protein